MKALQILSIALIGIIGFSSCKKDVEQTAPAPTVVGDWKGSYASGGTTFPYQFEVRTDGTMDAYDGPDKATAEKAPGTYTLNGTEFKATYKFTPAGDPVTVVATLSNNLHHMEGTWASSFGGGKIILDK